MFEQDYIIRLIKEIIRTILKLLFNIDTEVPTADLLENKEEKELLENLFEMVESGKINEAENLLYDLNDNSYLKISLLFYSYLNDKTDEFLNENDFSREEIKSGLKNITDYLGLESITKIFLTDL